LTDARTFTLRFPVEIEETGRNTQESAMRLCAPEGARDERLAGG